ncbi:MAG: cation:proton antiporter [Clostridiales bacterium]|nr:cation:proton antiporter [Clostridiales bacterium]
MFDGNTALGFAAVLAIILLSSKLLGLLFRKIGIPQVLGFIVAGILIGPAIFGDFCGFSLIGFEGKGYTSLFVLPQSGEMSDFLSDLFGREVTISNGLDIFAKIGVLLLMFSAGLETNLNELKRTGVAAVLMACAGVAVPMILGFAISMPFGGIGLGFAQTANIFRSIFIGTILTATSVAITVSVLKELGKIRSKLGTTIVSAAIIDDVIGIVLLSVVTGIARAGSATGNMNGFDAFKSTIYGTIIMIVCFFVFAFVAGIGIHYIFHWLEKKRATTHRIPIFSLAICFLYSWIAEEIFGVADITGAFLAGVVLSTAHRASAYADSKIEVCTYTLFAPAFFANIGISAIHFTGLNGEIILFALLAVLVGLIGKIIGCGAVCKAFKYNWRESAIGGVGMMARGEVALIVTSTVTNATVLGTNALPEKFMIMTVLLILVSSILTPILLKLLYSDKPTLHFHRRSGKYGGHSHGDESAPEFPEQID